ncbi:MAG: hypothetical protein Sapg2KO_42280 [Saprospiraceae bacterium]
MNKYLFRCVSLLILSICIVFYFYNLPIPSLKNKKADYDFTAEQLFDLYKTNEANADQKLLDKTLLVKGTVKSLVTEGNQLSVILECGDDLGRVVCELDHRLLKVEFLPKPGEVVTIKGACTGMLLEIDVILLRCILVS